MIICVYKIESTSIPGALYVGGCRNFSRRRTHHIFKLKSGIHHSANMQKHVNKYGVHDLNFEIIERCQRENLIELEQKYIDLLNPCFNMSKTAGSNLGFKHTEESKKLMRKVKLGKKYGPMSDAQKLQISLSRKGIRHSEERKQKISQALKGRVISEEWRKKMSLAKKCRPSNFYGKRQTEEVKLKISKKVVLDTGEIINSIGETAKKLGKNRDYISRILHGHHPNTLGIKFA